MSLLEVWVGVGNTGGKVHISTFQVSEPVFVGVSVLASLPFTTAASALLAAFTAFSSPSASEYRYMTF